MNLDFIPTHCVFCEKRMYAYPKDDEARTLGCNWCLEYGGDYTYTTYNFHCVNGEMLYLMLIIRPYRIFINRTFTVVKHYHNEDFFLHINESIPFDFDTDKLKKTIEALILFQ